MNEKKIKRQEEILIIRSFMKQKKITIPCLSNEMGYSIRHITRVFNDSDWEISPRFMKKLFRGLEDVLEKDKKGLQEFYNLLRGTPWTILVWDSIPSFSAFR